MWVCDTHFFKMVRATGIKIKKRQRMFVISKPAEFLILCECVLSILENLIYLPLNLNFAMG